MWVVGVELDSDVDLDVVDEVGDNDVDVGVCVPHSIIRNRSNAQVTHMRVAAVVVVVVDNCGWSSM